MFNVQVLMPKKKKFSLISNLKIFEKVQTVYHKNDLFSTPVVFSLLLKTILDIKYPNIPYILVKPIHPLLHSEIKINVFITKQYIFSVFIVSINLLTHLTSNVY